MQCHGEHTLVEIFHKRNFTCDCGTKRLPPTSPCSLRLNPATNAKGGVHSEDPDPNNKYNQNFRNRFCGCSCDYDPFQQNGTMFQCLGLGTSEDGGCGEDWWHPGCLVGLGPDWVEKLPKESGKSENPPPAEPGPLATISEADEARAVALGTNSVEPDVAIDDDDGDPPPPPGFPPEDDFEGFLCYKCVDAYPWVRGYAGAPGFLAPVFCNKEKALNGLADGLGTAVTTGDQAEARDASSKKRRASECEDGTTMTRDTKRTRSEEDTSTAFADVQEKGGEAPAADNAPADQASTHGMTPCKLTSLPPAPTRDFSLFLRADFRSHICRCDSCFPLLKPHPQLLEEEETYEPPVSEDGGSQDGGGSTNGSGSLLDRGESALRNIDRVRAIEGVMAYNHLKDKLKPFFQQFAESGQAISADDIKDYFAKLRGDDQALREAGQGASPDSREEQRGY